MGSGGKRGERSCVVPCSNIKEVAEVEEEVTVVNEAEVDDEE